eukprot:PhM_4_TR18497/c0_g1_i1/m.72407/K10590/TRIP12; E3 ubiquitin-protein ligase TRIP12
MLLDDDPDVAEDIRHTLSVMADASQSTWSHIRASEQLCTNLMVGGPTQLRLVDPCALIETCSRCATASGGSDRVRLLSIRAVGMYLKMFPIHVQLTITYGFVSALNSIVCGPLLQAVIEDALVVYEVLVLEVATAVIPLGVVGCLIKLTDLPDPTHKSHVVLLLQRICARCRPNQWDHIKGLVMYFTELLELPQDDHSGERVHIACRGISALVYRIGLPNRTMLQTLATISIPPLTQQIIRLQRPVPSDGVSLAVLSRLIVGTLAAFHTASPSICQSYFLKYNVYEAVLGLLSRSCNVPHDVVVRSFEGLDDDVSTSVFLRREFCHRYLMDFLAYIMPSFSANPVLECDVPVPFHNWSYGDDTTNLVEHSEGVCVRIHDEFLKCMRSQRNSIVQIALSDGLTTSFNFDEMKQYDVDRDYPKRLFYDPIPFFFIRRRPQPLRPHCACIGIPDENAQAQCQAGTSAESAGRGGGGSNVAVGSSACCCTGRWLCFGTPRVAPVTDSLELSHESWHTIRPRGEHVEATFTTEVKHPEEFVEACVSFLPQLMSMITVATHGGILRDCTLFVVNTLHMVLEQRRHSKQGHPKNLQKVAQLSEQMLCTLMPLARSSLGDARKLIVVTHHVMRSFLTGEHQMPRFSVFPSATFTLSGQTLCLCLTALHMLGSLQRATFVPAILQHGGISLFEHTLSVIHNAQESITDTRETECRLHPTRSELLRRVENYTTTLKTALFTSIGPVLAPPMITESRVSAFHDFAERWTTTSSPSIGMRSRNMSGVGVLLDFLNLVRDQQLNVHDVVNASPEDFETIARVVSERSGGSNSVSTTNTSGISPSSNNNIIIGGGGTTSLDFSELGELANFLHQCVAAFVARSHDHETHTRHSSSACMMSQLFLDNRPSRNVIATTFLERSSRPLQVRLFNKTPIPGEATEEPFLVHVLPFATIGNLVNFMQTRRQEINDRLSGQRTEGTGRAMNQFEFLFQQACIIDLSHVAEAAAPSSSPRASSEREIEFYIDGEVVTSKRLSIFEALLTHSSALKTFWEAPLSERPSLVKTVLSSVLAWWSHPVTVGYVEKKPQLASVRHQLGGGNSDRASAVACPTCGDRYLSTSEGEESVSSGTSTLMLCTPHAYLAVHDFARKCPLVVALIDLYAQCLRCLPKSKHPDTNIFSSALFHEARAVLVANQVPTLHHFTDIICPDRPTVEGLAQYTLWKYPDIFSLHHRTAAFDLAAVSVHVPFMRASFVSTPGRITLGIDWLAQLSGWGSTHRKLRITVRRSTLLTCAEVLFERYASYPTPFEVMFFEEAGTGVGPTTEFYVALSQELQEASLGLWQTDSDGIFPALLPPTLPDEDVHKRLAHYRLFGRMVARALREGRLLDVQFHPLFFELLFGGFGGFEASEDSASNKLHELDEGLENALRALVKEAGEDATKETHIVDMCLEFTLPGVPSIELIPGGGNVAVTVDNLHHFIQCVRRYRLKEGIQRQMTTIASGIDDVMPMSTLTLFTPKELELLLSGSSVDSKVWNTEANFIGDLSCAHGYTVNSRAIRDLTQLVIHMSAVEQRAFLRFVTGCPRVPRCGLKMKITIVRKDVPDADRCLPTVNTCFHYLKLPEYSTMSILKDKLGLAVLEGQTGFEMS